MDLRGNVSPRAASLACVFLRAAAPSSGVCPSWGLSVSEAKSPLLHAPGHLPLELW